METNISNAEWKVMRIIWTEGRSTSTEMSKLLAEKYGWGKSTVKTLLGRLVDKQALKTEKSGRSFIYSPAITEDEGVNEISAEVEDKVCAMKIPSIVEELVINNDLTRDDIARLQTILEEKKASAVATIKCNCMPDGSC